MKKLTNTHDIDKNYVMGHEKQKELTEKFWNSIVDQIQQLIDDYGIDGTSKVLFRSHEGTGTDPDFSMKMIYQDYQNIRDAVYMQVMVRNHEKQKERERKEQLEKQKIIAEQRRQERYEQALRRKQQREADEKLIAEFENKEQND